MKLKLVNITTAAILSLGLMSSAMAGALLTPNQPNKSSSVDRPVNQEKFAERKQEILNRMDQRRSCVANAQNPSEMKNCHKGDGPHRMGPRDGGGNQL